jgi:hypothetical protein
MLCGVFSFFSLAARTDDGSELEERGITRNWVSRFFGAEARRRKGGRGNMLIHRFLCVSRASATLRQNALLVNSELVLVSIPQTRNVIEESIY